VIADNETPSSEDNTMPSFECDIDLRHRTVTELAPVLPPEFLRRLSKELPLVKEAEVLIGRWYLYLSHILYEETLATMAEGKLDENLNQMYHWLTEVKGQTDRLHPIPGTVSDQPVTQEWIDALADRIARRVCQMSDDQFHKFYQTLAAARISYKLKKVQA
jgi:hypothetical protein